MGFVGSVRINQFSNGKKKKKNPLDKAPSLSLPLFHLLAFSAIWGNPSPSGIPAYSQSQGGLCLRKPSYNGASPPGSVTYECFSFISFVKVCGGEGVNGLLRGLEHKN